MIKNIFKGILLGLLILVVGFIAWQGSLSFSLGKQKTITVTGTGKVKMKPEVARFTAGVQKYGSTIKEAVDQEKEATKNVIETLKGAGIEDSDIKTAYYSIWPQTSDIWENNIRKVQITGYSVSNSVEVKIRNVDQVSSLLAQVIASGANNISGVSFGADEPKEQEAQARELAIKDATQKAEEMAKAAGKKLGSVISITEGYTPYVSTSYSGGGGGGGGAPAIESGGLEVAQTVTAVFVLK